MNIEHLRKQKILYVEDDTSIMSSFSKILQKVFGEVVTAVNGKEGLEQFKENLDTSFIITDIKMPKMDGLEMVKEIKTINPKVPCILTTAHGEYDYFLKAQEIGIYRYIQKPININELLKSISEYEPES